jgi:hypothetical protein
MYIKSRICLLVSVMALIVASGCLGPGTKENLTSSAAEPSIKVQENSQKGIKSSSLPGWNISVNTKGLWAAYITDDRESNHAISGNGNETFLRANTNNITVKVMTDKPGDFVTVMITNNDAPSGEKISDSGIGAVIVSNNGKPKLWKPIVLLIDKKSIYRHDVPFSGLYNDNQDLLYNTVVSDLLSSGYRVVSQAENQANVANKLILIYEEDKADDEWAMNDNVANSPKIRGTFIKCEVELRNLTNNIDIKKKIYARTKPRVSNQGNMAEVLYLSAFDDFNEQLLKIIHSGLVQP